jgi:hypothetical protein
MKGLKLAAATAAIGALGVMPSTAAAVDVGDTVTGTTLGTLSLTVGTGATFGTNLAPGATPTAVGALTATSTNPSWTLSVKDNAATGTPGTMDAAAAGCDNSVAELPNATNVTVTSALPGVTSAGQKAISGASQTVASASSQLLAANLFTTNYSVAIPASTALTAGCVYSMTATYTLQ